MTETLVEAFLAQAPANCSPAPELGHVLARQLAVARAAHPDLSADPERFCGVLGTRCGAYEDVLEAVRESYAPDLFLVLAAEGSDYARDLIHTLLDGTYEPELQKFVTPTHDLDDVIREFWSHIDLRRYDGGAPLPSWLMTSGLGALRHSGWTQVAYRSRPWWSDFPIDLEFVEAAHRDRVALALHEALLDLDGEEQVMWDVAVTGDISIATLDENKLRAAELFQRPIRYPLPSELAERGRRNAMAALEVSLRSELSDGEVAAIMASVPERIDALFKGFLRLRNST